MNNPLLETTILPQFSKIKPEHIEPAIDGLLAEARQQVEDILAANSEYNWQNLIAPLEAMENKLNKAWSPISHMNSVINSDALRDAYNACLPKLSAYATEMGQNRALFKAYQQIAQRPNFETLTTAQQKIINNALRDFRLTGIDLDADKQQRYKEISQSLSRLTSQFEQNLLDATHHWKKQISRREDLSGLPESALAIASQAAESEGQQGWLLTLQIPCFMAVMTFADQRELRQEMYQAYYTRASELNPETSQWDNSDVMDQLLALRHERSLLLGFSNYAEYSLATKMASSTDEVISFLTNLAEKSKPRAEIDLQELQSFVQGYDGLESLEAWDIAYYSEKMRQHEYDLSQEEVKAYFPVDKVVPGLFAMVEKLYGLKITEIFEFESWHEDARFFQILDAEGTLRGHFYLDLYARNNKRGGAWMDDCVGRMLLQDQLQTPVAYLTSNFTPPAADIPALLTHDEVLTLFHEFGHGLQHMLTRIDYLGVSGINGVEWDAVELPSQIMENWCWEAEVIAMISGHYQTGEKLPEALYKKMLKAKNFQSGLMMIRQLEFSLFDFQIHLQYDVEKGGQIYPILNQIRERYAVIHVPEFNRFAHGFAHIFAGGYAAGYYSYKWAEV